MNTATLFTTICFISLSLVAAHRRRPDGEKPISDADSRTSLPFIQTRISEIGEKETRAVLRGVRALETTVPSEGEHFLFVREAVKNNRLVWIVYKHKQIVDCNISTHDTDVKRFMRKFDNFEGKDENEVRPDADDSVPVTLSDLLDFRGLLKTCRAFTKQVRALRIEKHHLEKQTKLGVQHQESNGKSRQKRSVFSMIYPGTNWCGRGDQAVGGYDDLGENVATDRCCREHDHCPYMIDSFETNYNYWNYRLHTITHCNCEERFKACLKSASNTVANMVGYIYFNYVGTECFTLKPVKSCIKRSWWGNCLQHDKTYTATVSETSIDF